jgi:hypothetical protein
LRGQNNRLLIVHLLKVKFNIFINNFLVNRIRNLEKERGPKEVILNVEHSIESFSIPLYHLITHLNFDSLGKFLYLLNKFYFRRRKYSNNYV